MGNGGISVVVMAYNEAPSLEACAEGILETLRRVGRPFEILIVDDGSADGTGEAADRLAGRDPLIRRIRHPVNQGLGAVYRTGFQNSRHEWVSFFPADGQFPPEVLERLLALAEGNDMVLGYVEDRKRPLAARLLSGAEKSLYRWLVGPLPRFQGVGLFRRGLFSEFTPTSAGRGWVILMELILLARRGGCRILSVPVELRPRSHGRSKVNNLRTLWANLRGVVALAARCRSPA